MLQEELERLIDLKQRQEEIINEIKENPKKMEEYFEKAPYFFTTLWLMYRKYNTEFVFTSFLIIRDNVNSHSNNFIYSFYKYYFNYDASTSTNSYKADIGTKYEDFFYSELTKEVDYMQDILNLFEVFEEFDSSYEEEQIINYVILSTDFKYHFIIPIYEGKYDYYLEKLAKKCLLKLSLKEVK